MRQRDAEFNVSGDFVTPEPECVRLFYGAGYGWLSAECSLPRLGGLDDNAALLDWPGCLEALGRMQAAACESTGMALPDVSEWTVTRLDSVWAWPVEPALYLAALRWARLPQCEPRSYAGSVSWMTCKGGNVRARAYDKRAETGRDVELAFRLERQTRPRREQSLKVNGAPLPLSVGELSAAHPLGVVEQTMRAVGLDKPVPGPFEARRLLVERWGSRRGRNLFRVLGEVHQFGGVWPGDIPTRTRQRYERQLRAAGVRSLAWEGELPALPMPSEPALCASSTWQRASSLAH